MSARLMFAIGVALLAISVPTAQGCNIVGDRDAAVRMVDKPTGRDLLSVNRTGKLDLARHGTHRVGDPWPSTGRSVPALASYPR